MSKCCDLKKRRESKMRLRSLMTLPGWGMGCSLNGDTRTGVGRRRRAWTCIVEIPDAPSSWTPTMISAWDRFAVTSIKMVPWVREEYWVRGEDRTDPLSSSQIKGQLAKGENQRKWPERQRRGSLASQKKGESAVRTVANRALGSVLKNTHYV